MKKNYLFIVAFFCTFNLFSRTIIFNIENGGPYNGDLYSRNENVVIGDVIRCTNNLPFIIDSNNWAGTSCRVMGNNGFWEIIPVLFPGEYIDYTLTDNTITQFDFIFDEFNTATFRNNRLNLTYTLSAADFLMNSFHVALDDTNKLSISKYSDESVDIHVFNLLGKEMYREENAHFVVKEIDFNAFSDGIYIVKLRTREKIVTQKVLKR